MIKAIRVGNFKAFRETQRIPLRPLTLIFGANSAGKSSIIHSLALAHHAVETGDLDVQRTQIGGESIDLGGFLQFVHRRDHEQWSTFGVELDCGELPGRLGQILRGSRTARVDLQFGTSKVLRPAPSDRIFADKEQTETEFGVQRVSLSVDGTPLLAMSRRPGGSLRLDRFDRRHPAMVDILKGALLMSTTTLKVSDSDLDDAADAVEEQLSSVTARCTRLMPRLDEPEEEDTPRIFPVGSGKERRKRDLQKALRQFLQPTLRQLVNGLADHVESQIRNLTYLGPLRSYPPRHLAFAQHHDPNWFAGGGHAWDVVRKDLELRKRVNTWLGSDRLQTPYTLLVRELVASGDAEVALEPGVLEVLMAAFSSWDHLAEVAPALLKLRDVLAHSGPEGEIADATEELRQVLGGAVDSEEVAGRLADLLRSAARDPVQDLVLIDQRTNTPVSHRDVGIGVSQVLPVLVTAFASRGRLVAIEQPEIHLHPALQAELGDVFISSALGVQKNAFLLETHSEHLILRILRRIRETSDGALPDGACPVRPEDVAVLYVAPGPRDTEVVEIPINAEGEFERPWPQGFFPERARELF